MATYTATFPAPRQHNLVLTLTEGTKDLSTQRVNVGYRLQVVKGVNWKTWTALDPGNQPWSITLGGVTVASGTSLTFNFDTVTRAGLAPGTAFTIAQGSYSFAYDADGTLDLSVAFSADADVWSGGAHGSGTEVMGVASYPSSGTVNFTPSPISVATVPSVTPKSANVGEVVTIDLPRQNVAYTHDVTWESGSLSGTVATGVATQTTWTVADVTAEFPTQAQSPVTITATTKNGATVVGTRSTTLLVWNEAPSLDPVSATPFDLRIRRVQWDATDERLRAYSPIIVNTLRLTDTASSTPTLEVSTSGVVPGADTDLEGALVVLEVQNGVAWQSTGLLFSMSRAQGDDVEPTETVAWSGIGYMDYLLARAYLVRDWTRSGSGTNAGNMMRTLFTDAKARGWGSNVDVSFTEHVTAAGDGWQTSGGTREISGGLPYSQILESFVKDGWASYRSRYDESDGICYLDMWNPETGLDWTSSSAQVTVNFATAKVSESPTTWSSEGILDRVYAQGDAPEGSETETVASAERTPYNALEYGVLEGWATAAGQSASAGVREVAKNALDNATETKSRQFTYSAFAVPRNMLPYYTFKPHDWVLIPADRDRTADPVSERVSQVVIDKSADGAIQITVICGDLIPAGASAAIMKRIKASTGGSISGGTLKDPVPLQSIIPAAPNFAVEEAAISTGYWDSNGEPRSYITFEWEPVVSALDEVTPVTVDYYEIWWRPNAGVDWALKTFSTTTSVEMDGWPVGFDVQLRVRARSAAGAFGAFSAWDEVTTVAPTASIPALAVDSLYTDGLGNIFADWNGTLGDTSAIPSYFSYMRAEISPDDGTGLAPTGAWEIKGNTLQAAGTITINPGSFGIWWVRFRAYDALGGPGANGTAEDIETTDPGINPPQPAAPTGLASTPGAAWGASGFFPEAWFDLTWDAVTEDVDTNPVAVVGYDLFGSKIGDPQVRYLTSSNTNSVRYPVGPGEEWSFEVRAASNFGAISAPSVAVVDTADAVITAAPAPAAPVLAQYAGLLRIQWSGGGMLPQIKTVYATISTALAGTYTRAGMPLTGAGEIVVPGLATGVDYYAKIVMVDESGQTSTSAAAGPILLQPITGTTVQTSEVANTGIKMTSGSFTAYDASGDPTFILDATTGEVWIAPYDAVFALGAPGEEAETGDPTTGIAISSESSSFNTFIHPSGVQIRNDQTPLSWWEADATDASLVNFFSPRAVVEQRMRMGDYEFLRESKTTGSRLVIRYVGA